MYTECGHEAFWSAMTLVPDNAADSHNKNQDNLVVFTLWRKSL